MKEKIKQLVLLFSFLIPCTLHGQKNIAEVNKIKGFYVFVDCQPTAEYEAVGEVVVDEKDDGVKKSGGQYESVRDNLIKMQGQRIMVLMD